MKIGIVCGSWNARNGRPSPLFGEFVVGMLSMAKSAIMFNGGCIDDMYDVIKSLNDCDAIVWAIQTAVGTPRFENISKLYPDKVVMVTINNTRGIYGKKEIVAKLKEMEADLIFEVGSHIGGALKLSIYDRDGNSWGVPEGTFQEMGRHAHWLLATTLKQREQELDEFFDDLAGEDDEDLLEFIVYWDDGTESTLYGRDIDDALAEHGYDLDDYNRLNGYVCTRDYEQIQSWRQS